MSEGVDTGGYVWIGLASMERSVVNGPEPPEEDIDLPSEEDRSQGQNRKATGDNAKIMSNSDHKD